MDQLQRPLRVGLFVLLAAVLAVPATAADIVEFDAQSSRVSWKPRVPFEHGILTIATPDGRVVQREFGPGGAVSFDPFAQAQPAADGTYVWQVMLGRPSTVSPKLTAAARANRDGDGDPDVDAAHRAAAARATLVQSGAFQILHGKLVPAGLVEPGTRPKRPGPRSTIAEPFERVAWPLDDPSIRPVDQVIPDDLIVQGSLCVGLDCVNNENFGFDTIRLKENNTRIKFDDTSTASGFPANDWQLTANDSASGGASKFSIEDVTGAKVPFTIIAGASTNSIFVDGAGRVGLRTSTPVLDLHLTTGDTPAHRLEQNASGGFFAQTWDIAGNEANFFVRDVTGGSRLPFRIRPGAPTSSVDINASGNVGVGTASPGARLHVASSIQASERVRLSGQEFFQAAHTDTNGVSLLLGVNRTGDRQLWIADSAALTPTSTNATVRIGVGGTATPYIDGFSTSATPLNLTFQKNGGNVGIGTTTPANPLQMASGAFVSAAGVWTNASSRELKQDIRDLSADEARIALEQLTPVRYT